MKTVTIQDVEQIVSVLTDEQKQVLKDTINNGYWGSCDMEFLDKDGNIETVGCYGYITNKAKLAGNFSGKKVSGLFRSIYSKLCLTPDHQIGQYLSHCSNWWGNGAGDVLFIRTGYYQVFEKWADH